MVTKLTVKVPENASVQLCGNRTSAKGKVRSFKTKLLPGKVWSDYEVAVSFEHDGETVTRKRNISISAGGNYVVDFSGEAGLYVSK